MANSYIWVQDDIKDFRVIDGDTVEVLFVKSLEGFGFKSTLETKQILRLARIDCYELRGKDERAQQAKDLAIAEITAAVEKNKLKIVTYKAGKFGRYLADIWCNERNLNNLLIEKGLAKRYGKN